MLQQIVLSIQWAMVDQARVTAFTLANMWAARRESYLSHFPHRFTSSLKVQLYQLDMDSDLLFNMDSMDKAIGQAHQVALVLFTEATARLSLNRSLNRECRLWRNIHDLSLLLTPTHSLVPLTNGSLLCALNLAILLKLVILLHDNLIPRHFKSDSSSSCSAYGCLG